MRPITNKTIQVHEQCVCGYNSVYTSFYPIRWRDLGSHGIKRKKYRHSGKPLLSYNMVIDQCEGHDLNGYE
ncbi:MAG: hypothetical protein LBL13_10370 [Bacteroidales bacterium]|jgi:hypothetical protein|nr:hypothetical protein [Bacteroidales bacterium]